ncbi:hypothetical protein HLB30_04045 [Peptostreptococcus russellii]|uniref:hypothetical protein n=1 Tax=Peptostreptococcus russellii TaxID=215200 RepID=UPI00162A7C39|nr:hypothetical protein [Peptostreptococcus russellii]MBC2577694.1 hypothetical protein [Peptostreptococcus russellii]
MKISSIDKGIALSFKELMSELRPEIAVEIFEEDYELLKLGMMEEDANCTVEVDISDEEVDSLCEEIVKLQENSFDDIEDIPDYSSENYKKYERYRWLPSMFI